MDHDLRFAQDTLRRYREMLEQEQDIVARAKLQGLIMVEEDKIAYLSRECFEMEDRLVTDDGPRADSDLPVTPETAASS